MRVYLANRGVWEAIVGAGPTCSVAATDDDVDAYLARVRRADRRARLSGPSGRRPERRYCGRVPDLTRERPAR